VVSFYLVCEISKSTLQQPHCALQQPLWQFKIMAKTSSNLPSMYCFAAIASLAAASSTLHKKY
jgi:hypothetical protein